MNSLIRDVTSVTVDNGKTDRFSEVRRTSRVLKVVLVEDESIVREALRDNIPWQQCGYEFVGEAGDGEMALPLIRKERPDLLITDIKMPFMDGLALSRIAVQEFPNMKVVIISGYDEFEYARQAIQVGVEQYLLKPITKAAMRKVLLEIKDKIESEREQKNYLEKFRNEMHEYEQFSRRRFFEKVFSGQMAVQEIYEEAQKLSLEIDAPCYNLVFVCQQEKKNTREGASWSELFTRQQEELLRFFLRYPEYLVFQWNTTIYGILIKGEKDWMEDLTERCIGNIQRICSGAEAELDWYAAAGKPVERLSMLSECYNSAYHILSYRFLLPDQHILTEKEAACFLPGHEEGALGELDIQKVDPEVIRRFLDQGQKDEIEEFVHGYVKSLQEPLKSKMFRDYVILSIRFTAIGYMNSLGVSQEEFLKALSGDQVQEMISGMDDIIVYMRSVLTRAMEIRDRDHMNQSRKMMKKALDYIESHYSQDTISLNSAAKATNVSANYFSAVFSQEMQMTFTEYVTGKRMEKARRLLRQTEKSSGEIALEVGYKDPHYFSFVFKKTQGCTPREYRNGKRRG